MLSMNYAAVCAHMLRRRRRAVAVELSLIYILSVFPTLEGRLTAHII